MSANTPDPSEAATPSPVEDARAARRERVRTWCKRFALGALLGAVALYTLRGVGLGVLDNDGVARWMLLGPRDWEIPARETLQRHLLIFAAVLALLGEPWRRLDADQPRAEHPYELAFSALGSGVLGVWTASACAGCVLLVGHVFSIADVWFSVTGWPLHLLVFVLSGCAGLWAIGGRFTTRVPSPTTRTLLLAVPIASALAGVLALGARDGRTPTPDPRKRHEQMVARFGDRYTKARAHLLAHPTIGRFFGAELQAHPHKSFFNYVDHVGPWSAMFTTSETFAPHDRAVFSFDVSGTTRAGHCLIAARWVGDTPKDYRDDLSDAEADRPLLTCAGTFKTVPAYYVTYDKQARRWLPHMTRPKVPPTEPFYIRENRRWALAFEVNTRGEVTEHYILEEHTWKAFRAADFRDGMGADGVTFPIVGAMPPL